MSVVENCGNCVFWLNGCECHKRAPGGPYPYRVGEEWFADVWPHTMLNEFCGDFELKDAG